MCGDLRACGSIVCWCDVRVVWVSIVCHVVGCGGWDILSFPYSPLNAWCYRSGSRSVSIPLLSTVVSLISQVSA